MTIKDKAEEVAHKAEVVAENAVHKVEDAVHKIEEKLDVHPAWHQYMDFWKRGRDCPYQGYIINPYRRNEYGIDPLTELSWRLTLWKKENVFPIDLKIRAPAVFLTTLLIMKRGLTSFQRV